MMVRGCRMVRLAQSEMQSQLALQTQIIADSTP